MRITILSFLPLVMFTAGDVWANKKVDYTRQIKPLLKRNCTECHNAKVQKGGLRLDTAAEMFQGGDSGKPIIPGKSAKSLLVEVLQDDSIIPRMPYNRTPLNKKEIALITRWIDEGAEAPKTEKIIDNKEHWAFQQPKRPKVPEVKNQSWAQNPIDSFVLNRLEEAGIAPSPPADKNTLIRRVYLDLIGLPPSPKEVANFLSDESPDAYERMVDRLLKSPHYGERWGRHWLDVARYADSNGFTIDSPREIWKYRDWVIAALNKDMPFDQFVVEQIAGDMLPKATLAQKIATGFHRNTLINQEGGVDREQFRVEAVADRVATTGVVFLGLTLGCARCHDHKYDPISQKEYYQIFAFLNNQAEPNLSIATPELAAKRKAMTKELEEKEVALNEKLQAFAKNLEAQNKKIKENISMILRLRPDQRTGGQKRTLAKHFSPLDKGLKKAFAEIASLNKNMPRFPTTMVLQEMSRPRETHIHLGGDFTRKGDKVKPDVPAILHSLETPKDKPTPDRLDFARWLVDPQNPLIARVTMNRIWQRYFGNGLVQTENDFGTQGTLPTHPDLLDWLATEFQRQDWSLKEMHRLIVTSATYRQSSHHRKELAEQDPYNKLLARQNRLRLPAEIIRDNALTVSDLLSKEIGGPSVHPPQPEGIYRFTQVRRQWNTAKGPNRYRRGIYTFFQRSAPYPALVVFDAPDSTSTCTRRVRSNTPLQALTLLNDRAFLEIAQGLAHRILREGPAEKSKRIRFAFQVCLARNPSSWEADRLEQFLDLQLKEFQSAPKEAKSFLLAGGPNRGSHPEFPDEFNLPERAAWTALARVLLNLDEFITRE